MKGSKQKSKRSARSTPTDRTVEPPTSAGSGGDDTGAGTVASGGAGYVGMLPPQLRMISVELLDPDPLNPNVHTPEQDAALEAEVRRLGTVPKPVVVREIGGRFKIIDGEHSRKAARAAGQPEVLCQVFDVDKSEARRQLIVRNLHGKIDPVKAGRLFEKWQKEDGLSARALAGETGLSDGTIRNYLLYAEAAQVRNRYAAGSDDIIGGLTVQEVRDYMDQPAGKRNGSLDDHLAMSKEERKAAAKSAPAVAPKKSPKATTKPEVGHEDDEAVAGEPTAGPAAPEVNPGDEGGAEGADTGAGTNPVEAAVLDDDEQAVLDALDGQWEAAAERVRQKFLAAAMSQPSVRDFVRRLLKSSL